MAGVPSNPNKTRITLEMVDEDIVSRVATLFGVSYRAHLPRNPKWKETFQLACQGSKARSFMEFLYPLMGARRKEQINHALASFDPHLATKRKLTSNQEEEIFLRLNSGENYLALAKEFGVGRSTIYNCRLRKNANIV